MINEMFLSQYILKQFDFSVLIYCSLLKQKRLLSKMYKTLSC